MDGAQIAKKLILLGFMCFFSYGDIRRRHLPLAVLIIFIAIGLVWGVMDSGILLSAAAIIPGGCVLAASIISRGAIGAGDALTLAGVGLFTDAFSAVTVLFLGLLLTVFPSCVMLARAKNSAGIAKKDFAKQDGHSGTGKTALKRTLPFIPFMCAAFIIMEVGTICAVAHV